MGIEPTQPAWKAGALPLSYTRVQFTVPAEKANMGGAGFEPAKAVPPDLQSGPFGRLGIHPSWILSSPRASLSCHGDALEHPGDRHPPRQAELAVRLELTTYGLQNRCSAG